MLCSAVRYDRREALERFEGDLLHQWCHDGDIRYGDEHISVRLCVGDQCSRHGSAPASFVLDDEWFTELSFRSGRQSPCGDIGCSTRIEADNNRH
jgi:hypothetical protein